MPDVKPEPPPAGAAFRAAWRRARTQRARDLRNRRGKRLPPPVTGIRIDPGRQP